MFSLEQISHRLATALPAPGQEDCTAAWIKTTPRPAAVLIPFLQMDGGWHILYTRRTDHVEHHKGQVAFPGGRSDPGDPSPQFTALREAEEEIGLHPANVTVLGRLAQLPTSSGYCVTPVVGMMPWPYPLQLAEREVVRAFTIPLDWLADPSHRETRTRTLPGSDKLFPVIYFQHYDGELLWGVSAEITVNLLAALGLGSK
jgi:8-oxo-dGTP pyrophosphatase MutT (NUDIX family)